MNFLYYMCEIGQADPCNELIPNVNEIHLGPSGADRNITENRAPLGRPRTARIFFWFLSMIKSLIYIKWYV
jgi:hypothetical protein